MTGSTTLSATNEITLISTANDFSETNGLDATGSAIALVDRNGIRLGDIDTFGTLTVSALNGGAIRQTLPSGPNDGINVGAATMLTTTGPIILDSTFNDFSEIEALSAQGGDISLADIDTILLGDIDAFQSLTMKVNNSIIQTPGGSLGDAVDVGATTNLTAGNNIILDNNSNDFQGTVNATGVNIALYDATEFLIGNVNASGSLDINAAGGIVQGSSSPPGDGAVDEVDITTLDAGASDIVLDNFDNEFGVLVNARGGSITLVNQGRIILGDIDAGGNLSVDAVAGPIEQQVDPTLDTPAVNVVGTTTLMSSDSITLESMLNDFSTTDPLNADGTDISLADINSLMLGNIDATGTLAVKAGQSIKQTGGADALDVAMAADFTAGEDIILDNPSNTFADTVKAAGDTVSLADSDEFLLDVIEARDTLTVNAGGAITQTDAAEAINVANASTLTSPDAITLTNAANDFVGPMNANGTLITLVDANALTLGAITASDALDVTALDANVTGQVSTVNGATFTNPAENDIGLGGTDDGSDTTFEVTDAELDRISGGTITVNAGAGAITVMDVSLANTAADDLTLNAPGAATVMIGGLLANDVIVDAGAGTLSFKGNASRLGTLNVLKADLIDQTGDGVTVTGTSMLNADKTITLAAANDFVGTVDANGTAIMLNDTSAIELGTVNAAGDLTVTAAGAISQAMDGTATVLGSTALTGASIDLPLANDFDTDGNGDLLTAAATNGALKITDVDDLVLGEISATEAINIMAAGTLTVTANVTSTTASVRLLADNDNLGGEDFTVNGGATLSAGTTLNVTPGGDGAMTDTGTGVATLVAGSDGSGDGFVLTRIRFTALDLVIQADGSITQAVPVTIAGRLTANTSGDAVTLTDAGNSFSSFAADTDGTAAPVTVRTNRALALGNISASDLTVTAAGAITDAELETIDVSGRTELTANSGLSDITLDNDHDFGTVALSGAAASLKDTDGLAIGTTSVTSLEINTGGAITDVDGESITSIDTMLDAGTGDIELDNPDLHDFTQIAATGGDITIIDRNAIRLGALTLSAGSDGPIGTNGGDLIVRSNGMVTQTAATIVAGRTAIDSGGANVLLGNGNNDFGGSVDIAGAQIILNDSNDLVVGAIAASKTLDVTSKGDIADTDNKSVIVTGNTTIDAGGAGDIALDYASHDFAANADLKITNANDVTLNDANELEIAALSGISGDVNIGAQDRIELRKIGTDSYQIAEAKTWHLSSQSGDVDLDARIDSRDGAEYTGSLTVDAGGDVRFMDLIGAKHALDEVTVERANNVILGLNRAVEVDPDNTAAIDPTAFLEPLNGDIDDIFFADSLTISGATGNILLPLLSDDERGADFNGFYYGVNLRAQTGLDLTGSKPMTIDLYGKIGNTRSKAAGLSPIGPRSRNYEFNNCIIGDPTSCSSIAQSRVVTLADPIPEFVFSLDTDQVEQLFLSFGNEELWGLPSVFTSDLEFGDDEEADEAAQ